MSSDEAQEPEADSAAPPKRRRRWTGYVLLGLIAVFGFLVIRAALRVNTTPAYWEDHQTFLQDTPAPDLQNLASDIQSRTLREWSYPIGDGDGVRTVRYQFDEVNAWLATRLRPMLDNQDITLPPELGEFMLTQRDGDLVLAFDYTSKQFGPRIASLFFRFRETDDGPLEGGIHSARAGEQPLGVRYLVSPIASQPRFAHDQPMQQLLTRIGRREFIPLPPIPVDDQREATVLGIDVQPEGVDLLIRVAFIQEKQVGDAR